MRLAELGEISKKSEFQGTSAADLERMRNEQYGPGTAHHAAGQQYEQAKQAAGHVEPTGKKFKLPKGSKRAAGAVAGVGALTAGGVALRNRRSGYESG